MGIDSIIRGRLLNHSHEWLWDGPRFLKAPGVTLVRGSDERWTFVVGESLGYIKLSYVTHGCIEMARMLRNIPNKKEPSDD